MSCRRRKKSEAAKVQAVATDSLAQKFVTLDQSALALDSAPADSGGAAPEPEKKKRGLVALIVIVVALLAGSVVRSGLTAPQRPATTGGRPSGGVPCVKCGYMRSPDKGRPCKVCKKRGEGKP